jgi:hypothetical protein
MSLLKVGAVDIVWQLAIYSPSYHLKLNNMAVTSKLRINGLETWTETYTKRRRFFGEYKVLIKKEKLKEDLVVTSGIYNFDKVFVDGIEFIPKSSKTKTE